MNDEQIHAICVLLVAASGRQTPLTMQAAEEMLRAIIAAPNGPFGVIGACRDEVAEREVCAEDGPLLTAARELVSGSHQPQDCGGEYCVPSKLWLALQAEVMERLRANASIALGVEGLKR